MYGAIVGDIIGSTFEVENHRSKFFLLFRPDARFTDDTVCTIAVADILQSKTHELGAEAIADKLRSWCVSYLNRGYGTLFYQWLVSGVNTPYKSYGNGCLMRISPVALYGIKKNLSIEETLNIAKSITAITHNHIEALTAVYCYVEILYMLLKNKYSIHDAKEIIFNILSKYGYQYPDNISNYQIKLGNDLRASQSLLVACAGVLEADSVKESFENIVSVGGDTDTYCAIAGPIAESIWGLEDTLVNKAKKYFREFDKELLEIMNKTYE